jgi:hypothetical protein
MEDRSQGPLVDCKSAVKSDSERAKDAGLKGTGPSSKTLVKHPDLRIVLLAMRKKTCMHEHRTAARISEADELEVVVRSELSMGS